MQLNLVNNYSFGPKNIINKFQYPSTFNLSELVVKRAKHFLDGKNNKFAIKKLNQQPITKKKNNVVLLSKKQKYSILMRVSYQLIQRATINNKCPYNNLYHPILHIYMSRIFVIYY